jgi:hypothetical protein
LRETIGRAFSNSQLGALEYRVWRQSSNKEASAHHSDAPSFAEQRIHIILA